MIEMSNPRVRLPETATEGEPVEVRAMISHPMESGFRFDNVGKAIPRNIVKSFTCTYDGKEVFRATFHPAVSTNPYLVFYVVPTRSADLVFTWADDHGGVASHIARLEVGAAG